MKERPILFSSAMVKALLDGRKTQTRRIVKPQPYKGVAYQYMPHIGLVNTSLQSRQIIKCPYGEVGDRIWCKETWGTDCYFDVFKPTELHPSCPIHFSADGIELGTRWPNNDMVCRWRPSIFMRRWMSRITLEITGVRVERLQDISEADAVAEGVGEFGEYVAGCDVTTPQKAYRALWEQINGDGSWAANPFVWCLEFRRITT